MPLTYLFINTSAQSRYVTTAASIPTWSPTKSYAKGDLVSYSGLIFEANGVTLMGVIPGTDSLAWDVGIAAVSGGGGDVSVGSNLQSAGFSITASILDVTGFNDVNQLLQLTDTGGINIAGFTTTAAGDAQFSGLLHSATLRTDSIYDSTDSLGTTNQVLTVNSSGEIVWMNSQGGGGGVSWPLISPDNHLSFGSNDGTLAFIDDTGVGLFSGILIPEVIAINSDGSATFAGGQIQLNSDGSATFSGDISTTGGNIYVDNTTYGIASNGYAYFAALTADNNLVITDGSGNLNVQSLTSINELNVSVSGFAQFTVDDEGNVITNGLIYPYSGTVWANPTTRIIYDQYNEQAISTVSDTWNTDSLTTLISDPDYGYVAVNGSLFVRQNIQVQSFGGSTAVLLGNDGSIELNGNTLVDGSGVLYYSSGYVLAAGGDLYYGNGRRLADSGGTLYSGSGNQLADSGGDLYYGNGNQLADSGGDLYYGNGSTLADSGGVLYYGYGNGNQLADSGVLYYGNGYTLADSGGDLCYGNGRRLADSGGTLYSGSGNQLADSSGLLYPQQFTTGAAPSYVKGALYFDTTLNKLRVGGATAWETVTSI